MQTGDADRSLRERPNGLCSPGGSHPCTQDTGGMHVDEAPANEGREERACSAPGTCWRLQWDRGTDEGWWTGVTRTHNPHIKRENWNSRSRRFRWQGSSYLTQRGGGDKDSFKPVIVSFLYLWYVSCFINTAVKSKSSRICTKQVRGEGRHMDTRKFEQAKYEPRILYRIIVLTV